METTTRAQHTPNFAGHGYFHATCHKCPDSLVNINKALLAALERLYFGYPHSHDCEVADCGRAEARKAIAQARGDA